jgi:hypothetical protein
VRTAVCLGGSHEFEFFLRLLRPLRLFLFFGRQRCFLLIFPLIFDSFGHGMGSQYLGGGVLQVVPRLYGAVGSLRTRPSQ